VPDFCNRGGGTEQETPLEEVIERSGHQKNSGRGRKGSGGERANGGDAGGPRFYRILGNF